MTKYFILILLLLDTVYSYSTEYKTVTGAILNAENTLILYQMMKDVDELFCKEKIEYWAIGGTLLGAIRNGGIIPWDHEPDLDIGINNNQFDALLKLKSKIEQLGYILLPTTCDTFFKIFNKNSIGTFPYIDIFIFNNKDNDEIFAYSMYGRGYLLKSEIYPIKRSKFGSYYINCPANPIQYLDDYYQGWQTKGILYLGNGLGFSSFILTDKDFLPAMPTGPLENRMNILKDE